ncbi:MAG: succinate dehydrogenase assembly factor 2 [Gammaproteobacteria bacterium]|nr:succinate dehydrogenase assembly factor 2 [Gammaproteobacteria bacterium]
MKEDFPTPTLAKIKWHCRRGMLELDLLLLPFVDQAYTQLPPSLQQSFIVLLEEPDPDIYNWFLGAQTPPPAFQAIIQSLRDYHHTAL